MNGSGDFVGAAPAIYCYSSSTLPAEESIHVVVNVQVMAAIRATQLEEVGGHFLGIHVLVDRQTGGETLKVPRGHLGRSYRLVARLSHF